MRLDAIRLSVPREPELAWRRHVADERGGRHDRGARQIALAAEAHAILPATSEGREGALRQRARVGAVAEARAGPGTLDPAADRSEDLRDRFSAEAGIRAFDLAAD